MSKTRKPGLPAVRTADKGIKQLLEGAREQLMRWRGDTGPVEDRVVTFGDLESSGIGAISRRSGGRDGEITAPEGPQYTVGPLENLQAHPVFEEVLLEWEGTNQRHYSLTEIWRNTEDNLGTATLRGTAIAPVFADNATPGQTYYYWVRAVSTSGQPGAFNATAGVKAVTKQRPEFLLDELTGEITESQLYQNLNDRIDLIDGPESLPGSVNARVQTETQARQDADSALASDISTVQAKANDNEAAIQDEQTARADADEALASDITTLQVSSGRKASFANGFEDADFGDWNVPSGQSLSQSSNARSGSYGGLVSSTSADPSSTGSTDGVNIPIPEETAINLSGKRTRVSLWAKKPSSGAASEFAVAYSTADVGNSGWQKFAPTTSWQKFTFVYVVPDADSGGTDYVGIWGDTSGGGNSVLVDELLVEALTDEGELPAISENAAAIEEEKTVRADEDEALASDINTLQANVDNNSAAIQQRSEVKVDGNQVSAQYDLRLQTTVDGQLVMGGFGLAADGSSVQAGFNVDQLWVGHPDVDYSQGGKRFPFIIDGGIVFIDEVMIREAAIGSAQIADLAAEKINAGTINVAVELTAATISGGSLNINNKFTVDSNGNVQIISSPSGARMEMQNDVVKVFDDNGTLRVRLGNLSA